MKGWLKRVGVCLLALVALAAGLASSAEGQRQVVKRAPAKATVAERVDFYVQRLGDRRYVEPGPESEEVIVWHVAAEELGQIGISAIPALIRTLKKSNDDYERQQVFYALRLAVQHRNAEACVGKTYPLPVEAFPPAAAHKRLKADWLAWWGARGTVVTEAATKLELQARPRAR